MINNISLGVQTFGISKELTENIEETLVAIKKIGFDLLEPIIVARDSQGDQPKGFMAKDTFQEVMDTVRKVGLRSVSCHVSANLSEDPKAVASYIRNAYEVSGITHYIFGMMPVTKEETVKCAHFVNAVYEEVKNFAILLYHNHGVEYLELPKEEQTEDCKYLMDVFFKEAVPEIRMELDFGWAWFARVPFEELKRYFSKIEIVHLKDFDEPSKDGSFKDTTEESFAPIGEGKAYLQEVLDGLKDMPLFNNCIILDQDYYPAGMILGETIGYRNVEKLLQKM